MSFLFKRIWVSFRWNIYMFLTVCKQNPELNFSGPKDSDNTKKWIGQGTLALLKFTEP